jgi:integrase
MASEPIFITTKTGQKIRVLTPADYDAIIKVINTPIDQPNLKHVDRRHLATLFEVCWWTGMRYKEVMRLHQHPEYFQERGILLGRDMQLKAKRVAPERRIPVPPQLSTVMPYFFKNKKPPTPQVWGRDLRKYAVLAGLGTKGISPKITRAGIESWMFAAGIEQDWICLRQGHDSTTSLRHYKALGFTDRETLEIKGRLAGWGGLKL